VLGAAPLGDVVDDRIEQLASADLDRAGVDLHVADLAAGLHVAEVEEVHFLRRREGHVAADRAFAADVDVPHA
jgi:hypothetical protein